MTKPPRFGDSRRMRIGILGGSFNPAHAGHIHFATTALKRLRLDQVWLLVSPGNPLKDANTMAPLAKRLAFATARAAEADPTGRRIIATDIERHLNTRYTRDTLRALHTRFPKIRFVWLMGADNLTQLPHWRDWMGIARQTPFAILPRPPYNHAALAGQAAHRLARWRRRSAGAATVAGAKPPAWVFLGGREDPSSATELRKQAAGAALIPGEHLSPANQPRRPPNQAPPNRLPSGASPKSP